MPENVSGLYKDLIPDSVIPVVVFPLQTYICELWNWVLQTAGS